MAFSLAKASGVRIPDLVDHIPADGTSLPAAEIVNGILVTIASDGELEKAATGDAVAGILVSEVGSTSYAAPSGKTYSPTFIDTDKVTFIPVTGSLLIEADYTGTEVDFGATVDLTDETSLDMDSVATGTDFRVVGYTYDKSGNKVKALGFFTTPGYFTS